MTFRYRLISQHMLDASHDLVTLTFDLGGHGVCCWCRSSCSVCVQSLKFVSHPPFERYCALPVSALVGLLTLTLKLVRIIARGVDNRPTNFGVSRTFRSQLIGQQLSDESRELASLTFNLGGHSACSWCGHPCCICVPSLKFVGIPIRKILRNCEVGVVAEWVERWSWLANFPYPVPDC